MYTSIMIKCNLFVYYSLMYTCHFEPVCKCMLINQSNPVLQKMYIQNLTDEIHVVNLM